MQVLFNDLERDSVLKEFAQIDCFKEIETERSIFCKSWWTYQYAVFLKNTHLTMNVSLDQENTDLTFFVFSPLQSDFNSLSLIADIQASNIELHIVFISLQGNDANLKMNGDIVVNSHVSDVKASLLEEIFLLGSDTHSFVSPSLHIASHNVKTSHGAKIQRIPDEQMFYFESRGISELNAKKMLVTSYSEYILQRFSLSEQEKKQIYSFF